MAPLLEITGQFTRERFRFENDNGDVIVGDVECRPADDDSSEKRAGASRVAVKGPAQIGELASGIEYRFFGRWVSYKNKRTGKDQKQFAFNSFCKTTPVTREAVIGYLKHHGAGLRFGEARARKLWDLFGVDAVKIARTDPERTQQALVNAGLHYNLKSAELLANSLQQDAAIEAIKLDLTTLLTGRGFPKTLPTRVIQEWGNKAAQILRRDPYRLMEFPGCGFKRCDAMYLDLRLNPARLKRQSLCAWHSLNRDTDGHTWFPQRNPSAYLKANISGAGIREERALELGVRGRLLAKKATRVDGVTWYAERHTAQAEQLIADRLLASGSEKTLWPSTAGLKLTEHQSEVTSKALGGPICILGGSPGTGKTWAVSELVIAVAKRVGLDNILIGTPTGKAGVRVTENLQAKDIDLQARTWHSHLMQLESQEMPHFHHKVLIGDESSMLDTDLMSRIFAKRARGQQLLLVGDVHQLPPVGHGAPLRDLIAAGVPYGELKEIMRNSGGIVEACAAIRDCQPWGAGDNLHLVETRTGHLAEMQKVFQSAQAAGLDPIKDVQIVTAVNEKSALGRKELNKALQQMLNRRPGGVGQTFRVGDKVVNTKNGFFKELAGGTRFGGGVVNGSEKDEVYVANGELGEVTAVEPKSITVKLTAPDRTVQAFFGQEGGCTFELGYALSVHKSQGSDWPWVVVILDDYAGARMVCDRSWLYTAISRAKQHCFLIGQRAIANRMCRQSKIWHRKTFLKESILEGRARGVLANV